MEVIKVIKQVIIRVSRMLAAPLRWRNQQRYADDRAGSNTWEVANDKLLGLVRQTMAETGETATINVKGYSMRPFLEHLRDRVVLKPVSPDEIKLYDIVLAEIFKGVYVLHRVIEINGDELTLMGDGNIRGTEHCQRKDVCGVAIKLLRPNGHYIDTSDASYQRRVSRWLRLMPVRRWLLFLYKLTV